MRINEVKPDYSNAGGLQIFNGEEWEDWESENGENIDDYFAELDLEKKGGLTWISD